MEFKHVLGEILDFLTLYGDRFAIVCFGAALVIAVPLVVRLVLAVVRPLVARRTRAARQAAIVPAALDEPQEADGAVVYEVAASPSRHRIAGLSASVSGSVSNTIAATAVSAVGTPTSSLNRP
jgi:hypothetical protein